MQTRKVKDIPDADWGHTPDLQEWIDKSIEERIRQSADMKAQTKTVAKNDIFKTLKPLNTNYTSEFELAKHQVLTDIGVNDNLIVATLANGELTISFSDNRILIEPHQGGMVVDYHTFGFHTLLEITSYIPKNEALHSCIFAFACDNEVFEYLIQPMGAVTLSFKLSFTPHGEAHA